MKKLICGFIIVSLVGFVLMGKGFCDSYYPGEAFDLSSEQAFTEVTIDVPDSEVIHQVVLELSGYVDTYSFYGHTFTLVAPNGKAVILIYSTCFNGSIFHNTRLTDKAHTLICFADPPAIGDYRPTGNLSDFNGLSTNGTWSLIIYNDYWSGHFTSWGLRFTTTPHSPITVFRPSTGLWAIRGVTRLYFGSQGDIPVVSDYTGNGVENIGIYRPTSGLWAIRGITRVYFGREGDTPAPKDFTGDGTSNIAIYRNGLWAVRGITRVYFGSEGDIPN